LTENYLPETRDFHATNKYGRGDGFSMQARGQWFPMIAVHDQRNLKHINIEKAQM
jgi:hypothetical protein